MLAARISSSVKKDFTPRTRPLIQRCSIGSCHEDDRVQRQASDGDRSTSSAPPIVQDTLQSPGQPLDHTTRAFFEPHFGQDFSAVRVQSATTGLLQAKLTVNQPGDVYEQEADNVAEHIMRMAAPAPEANTPATKVGSGLLLQRQVGMDEPSVEDNILPLDIDLPQPGEAMEKILESPLVMGSVKKLQRKCAECDEEERLQAKAISGQPIVPQAGVEVLPGAGQPLDTSTRSFFESRFGYSFDRVRVHTGDQAAQAACAVNALAYTVGNHIVFGAGQYAPTHVAGLRLLAHELTHVLQQNSSTEPAQSSGSAGRGARIQAATGGRLMLQGRWVTGAPVAGVNTIVCDGSGGVRVQLGATGNADQTACLSDCMRRHEESHRADALASNASICNGEGANRIVTVDTQAERSATEIRASNVEIACLRAKLPTASATCRPIITSRITQMEAYRDSF
jgi:hypothetical protein